MFEKENLDSWKSGLYGDVMCVSFSWTTLNQENVLNLDGYLSHLAVVSVNN